MKKITLTFSILAVSALIVAVGCKKTVRTAPVADKNLETSVEISHALYAFIDAEQAVSFVAETDQQPKFYMPATSGNTLNAVVPADITRVQSGEVDGAFSIGWISTSGGTFVTCADGRRRGAGSVVALQFNVDKNHAANPPLSPSKVNSNSIYARRYGFSAYMTFEQYKVDDWKIDEVSPIDWADGDAGSRIKIVNNLADDKHTSSTNNDLSWTISGAFKIGRAHIDTVPTSNTYLTEIFTPGTITQCRINITKVLLLATTTKTFAEAVWPIPGGAGGTDAPLKWGFVDPAKKDSVKVGYYGEMSGILSDGKPFTLTISKEKMLKRNFNCYPDQVSGITVSSSGSVTATRKEEFHPFIEGVAIFTPDTLYPREINYGGSERGSGAQCDNSGSVYIKGISYPVDFRK
ncbi:MAG: hypothetical protein KF900_11170 [Bacteroidetes bacterium]|nr:hypothetical protein [Bacteroidota bacterium]